MDVAGGEGVSGEGSVGCGDGGRVHEPVGWRGEGVGGGVDVEGVEGGFGGVGD